MCDHDSLNNSLSFLRLLLFFSFLFFFGNQCVHVKSEVVIMSKYEMQVKLDVFYEQYSLFQVCLFFHYKN
jgi:hypothetical protein